MRRLLPYGLFILFLSACQNQTSAPAPEPATPTPPAASSSAPPREFKLEGDIISVNKESKSAVIKHGPIEGYMAAMTMTYPIPDSSDLDKIKAGDHITATVYDDQGQSKYWLGKIQVGEAPAK